MNIADRFRFFPFNVSFAESAAARRRKRADTFSRGPVATAKSSNSVGCHWLDTSIFEIKLKVFFF